MNDRAKTKKQLIEELTRLRRELAEYRSSSHDLKYRTMLESLDDVIYRTDMDGNILYISPAVEKLTGYTPQEIIGKIGVEALYAGPEDRERVRGGVERYGVVSNVLARIRRKDGETAWASINARLVYDDEGRAVGIEGSARNVTALKRVEDDLKQRIAMARLVVSVSANFIHLPSSRMDEGVAVALAEMGRFADADRCYVFLFDEREGTVSNSHEWCAEGVEPQRDNLQDLPVAVFPWFWKAVSRLEVVHIPRVADLPPEAAAEREILQAQDIVSLLAVPLVSEGEAVGFVGFDAVRGEKDWSPAEIEVLRLVSEILAGAIQRKRAEEALRESEERFAAFMKHLPAHAFMKDMDGRYLYFNETYEREFGYELAGFLGRPDEDIWPDRAAGFRVLDRVVMTTRRPAEGIEQVPGPDGVQHYLTSKFPIFREGEMVALGGIALDVTEQIKTEEALRESEERFAAFMKHLPALAFIKGLDRRYTYCNAAFEDILGIRGSDRLGKRVEDIWPERAELVNEFDDLVLESGRPMSRVEEVPCTDGVLRYFLVHKFPIYTDGQITALGCICLDVSPLKWAEEKLRQAHSELERRVEERTAELKRAYDDLKRQIEQRRRAEEARAESEAHFRALAESASGFAVFRLAITTETPLQAKVIVVSPSFKDIVGAPDPLRFETWLSHLHPDDRPVLRRANYRLIKSGRMNESFRVRHPEKGEWRWIQTIATTSWDESGRPAFANGIIIDVTERKLLEAQLAQAQKLESIGRLASGIAHEINTPTQYLGSNAYFLWNAFTRLLLVLDRQNELVEALAAGADVDEVVRELSRVAAEANLEFLHREVPKAIQALIDGVERITKIVRSMKSLAHPGADQKSAADINEIIEAAVTVAENRWKYVAELETDLDPELPPVNCLPAEMEQVFLNLIVNAAQAIEGQRGKDPQDKGRIIVSSRRDGDSVEVRVCDSGPGVPDELAPNLFDPFFTTKEVGQGTGLGLAISRSVVVDRHAGVLEFENRPEGGACFIVRLPLSGPTMENEREG